MLLQLHEKSFYFNVTGDDMTMTYFAENGETSDVNIDGNWWLSDVTFGLWDKIGIPSKLSKSETKIVARIIRNMIHYADNGFIPVIPESKRPLIQEIIKVPEVRRFAERMMKFFEESGGLITEEEYYERVDDGEYVNEDIDEDNDENQGNDLFLEDIIHPNDKLKEITLEDLEQILTVDESLKEAETVLETGVDRSYITIDKNGKKTYTESPLSQNRKKFWEGRLDTLSDSKKSVDAWKKKAGKLCKSGCLIIHFESSKESWEHLCGREYVFVIRKQTDEQGSKRQIMESRILSMN